MSSIERRQRGGLDPALAGLSRTEQIAALRHKMDTVPASTVESAASPPSVAAADLLAVSGPLGSALPSGGLVRGQIVGCSRGSVLIGLLAAITGAGHSAAIIGPGRLGLLAAHEMGGRLDRIWSIDPSTSDDPFSLVSVLCDGLDLVILDVDGLHITPSRARPVQAKLRNRGAVLLVSGRGITGLRPDLDIGVRRRRYEGLGAGTGRVCGLHIEMAVSGRNIRPYTARLSLAAAGGGTVRWSKPTPRLARKVLAHTG